MSGVEVAFFLPLDGGVFALFFERERGIVMLFQYLHTSSECRMRAYESCTTKKVQSNNFNCHNNEKVESTTTVVAPLC